MTKIDWPPSAVGDGHIERLAGSFPGTQFQRLPWYEVDSLVVASLVTSLVVLVCVLFNALLRLARRFVLRSSEPVVPVGRVRLEMLPVVSAVYWIVLMAALAALFAKIGGDADLLPPTSAWGQLYSAERCGDRGCNRD